MRSSAITSPGTTERHHTVIGPTHRQDAGSERVRKQLPGGIRPGRVQRVSTLIKAVAQFVEQHKTLSE